MLTRMAIILKLARILIKMLKMKLIKMLKFTKMLKEILKMILKKMLILIKALIQILKLAPIVLILKKMLTRTKKAMLKLKTRKSQKPADHWGCIEK